MPTQEQQIIDYLEANGPSLSYVIAKALGIRTNVISSIADRSSEISSALSVKPGTMQRAMLYSVSTSDLPAYCRHTVKATQGMAPIIPPDLSHFPNPFKLGAR